MFVFCLFVFGRDLNLPVSVRQKLVHLALAHALVHSASAAVPPLLGGKTVLVASPDRPVPAAGAVFYSIRLRGHAGGGLLVLTTTTFSAYYNSLLRRSARDRRPLVAKRRGRGRSRECARAEQGVRSWCWTWSIFLVYEYDYVLNLNTLNYIKDEDEVRSRSRCLSHFNLDG